MIYLQKGIGQRSLFSSARGLPCQLIECTRRHIVQFDASPYYILVILKIAVSLFDLHLHCKQ